MADLKISQLPAAAALTGSELIELVQSGGNVRSTAGAVSTATSASTLAQILGNPSSTFGGGVGSLVKWVVQAINGNSGAFTSGNTSSGNVTNFVLGGAGSALGAHFQNTSGATIYAASAMVEGQTNTAANAAADIQSASFGAGSEFNCYRALTTGLPIAGFSFVFYGGFNAIQTGQGAFIGMAAASGAIGGAQVPSALLNLVGFGKDQSDTNLQFMKNAGSGTATKTDTGIVFSGLNAHMVKIVITCDVLGNISASFTDLEAGGATVNYTVPTADAKTPAAGVSIQPHMYVNTGAGTVATKIGFHSLYMTISFI